MNALTTFPATSDLLPADPSFGPSPALAEMTAFTRERQAAFLTALAECGQARRAAKAAGVSHQTVYRARRACAAFRRGWDAALISARTYAEDVLATRALDGVEEDVIYRGEVVATRRRYDSRLLLAHLARLDKLTAAGAATPSASPGAEAFAEDFDASVDRFAQGSDAPEIDPAAQPAGKDPGQCNTRSTPEGEGSYEDGDEGPCDGSMVWCPYAGRMVLRDEATLNAMAAERPASARTPEDYAADGYDVDEVRDTQMAAFEAGDEEWWRELPELGAVPGQPSGEREGALGAR